MTKVFWNKAGIGGIVVALVTILLMVLQSVFTFGNGINLFLWVVKLAGTGALLYYFMKDYGKGLESYAYSDAFKFGLATSFCSSIITAAYYYLHMYVIFPENTSKLMNAMLEGLEQSGAASQLDVNLMLDKMPLVMGITMLLYYTIWGLIWSSIFANGVKQKTDSSPF